MLRDVFKAVQKIGEYIRKTWIGQVCRETPETVIAFIMVYIALATASFVVFFRRDKAILVRKKTGKDATLLDDLLSDDATFGFVYTAAMFIVSITLFGLVLWPWVSGNTPLVAIVASLLSMVSVWGSIHIERVMRVDDPSPYSGTHKGTASRMTWLHGICGIMMAFAVTQIPQICPYDPSSSIALALLENATKK